MPDVPVCTDFFGQPINVGSVVAYAVRRGSSMDMKFGQVVSYVNRALGLAE
jgi:hypothetical protein